MSVKEVLKRLKHEVEQEYLQNIQPYWYKYSMDDVNGGFYGTVSSNNLPVIGADKGGILNARILWSFSAAHRKFPSPENEELAHRAYNYMSDYLLDKVNGGVYWTVDYKGKVSDDRKHVYVQAFAIYGLTEYYAAFGDENALKKAIDLFHLIENHCQDDVYGGYYEAFTRDWILIDDVRLSTKDKNVPKSMNTHLHIMEGYTNLYRFFPSKAVAQSLEKLLLIFSKHIFNKGKYSLHCFFDKKWEPQSSLISYGHDIEASWLCLEASQVFGLKHWINEFETIAVKVSRNVIQGSDTDGGLINELTAEKIIDSDKDWWPQAEAFVGHLNAFQITGKIEFLNAALKSWDFIKAFHIDSEGGEWFEKVSRNGEPYDQLEKIRLWKAPYHNSRAMFEGSRRIEELLEIQFPLTQNVKVGKSA